MRNRHKQRPVRWSCTLTAEQASDLQHFLEQSTTTDYRNKATSDAQGRSMQAAGEKVLTALHALGLDWMDRPPSLKSNSRAA